MRIDAYNQVSQLYQASRPQKVAKKSETTVRDQFTVSSKGKDYQTAKKALAAAPDIREEKVAALHSAATMCLLRRLQILL